jgi:propionate CoA-transferase
MPPVTDNLLNGITKTTLKVDEKIISRRILLELLRLFQDKKDTVLVNLGIGIPALISLVAAQEGVTEVIVPVLESGPWGGVALSGDDFGLAKSFCTLIHT